MPEPAHPPLDPAEKLIVAALSASRLFSRIPTPELIELLPLCRLERAATGSDVFQDGDPGINLFVIIEGRVEVRMETITPNLLVTIATLEAGDSFGELAFADDKPRSGSVRCIADCEMLVMNGYKLKDFMDARPETGLIFFDNMTRLLAARLRKMNHKMLSLVRQRHVIDSMIKDQ